MWNMVKTASFSPFLPVIPDVLDLKQAHFHPLFHSPTKSCEGDGLPAQIGGQRGRGKPHALILNRGSARRVTGRRPAAPVHEKSHPLASRLSGPGPPSGTQRYPSFRVRAPLACALVQGRHLSPSVGSLPISYQPMGKSSPLRGSILMQ